MMRNPQGHIDALRWQHGTLILLTLWLVGCQNVRVTPEQQLTAYDVEPWREVLAGTVRDGMVDYHALRENHQEQLDQYLDAVARFGPNSTPEAFETSKDELAFYLNAYNALMFRKWLDGGAGTDDKTRKVNLLWFVVEHWRVDGQWMSLNTLEQNWIRPYDDARIHFALVCGAVSCPPLLNVPFEGPILGEQMEERGRIWLRDEPDGFLIDDEGRARLSQIFEWYLDDFESMGRMPGVLERYLEPDDPRLPVALESIEAGTAQWLPYDWTINQAE